MVWLFHKTHSRMLDVKLSETYIAVNYFVVILFLWCSLQLLMKKKRSKNKRVLKILEDDLKRRHKKDRTDTLNAIAFSMALFDWMDKPYPVTMIKE